MNPIYIVIPTLDPTLGKSVGEMAKATAGCPVEVIVVHDPKRQGFTKTVNEGIEQAPPDVDICLLNDDITWFQWNWLEIMRRVLYSRPEYGLTGPSGNCGAARIKEGRLGGSGTEIVGHISFWCVLMKREMLNALGLLDEAYIHYNSDSWYCIMMSRAGWERVWVKSVFLVHEVHGSGRQIEWRNKDIQTYRNRK